jgi:uncharacterized protein
MMKQLALGLIKAYRYTLSPLMGNNCRFHPSCSDYAYQAIQTYGLLKGAWLGIRRLLRCHPWSAGGFDPLP